MSGKLYGIGVGPGDPELLTLKAHRILTASPVIAYPAPDFGQGKGGESFARSIVAAHISPDQEEIPIFIPMRTERFPAREIYDRAATEIGGHLDAGRDVCVLCEGDPFFYGSFMYLFERLADSHPVEIVPGVSSLMASAAALGRPIAARNDRLTVLPAPLDDEALLAAISGSDAIAIMKVGRHLKRVRALIEKAGLLPAAGYLERIGLANQRVLPLIDLEDVAAPYFSMILIYKGAEDWIAQRPLTQGDAA
ncbi:MAG: precorrin-2 C(20)-methyltransferase [Salaquimonas sp.]|nr:precorrin-2 C(20)-methyltransferase [Salaquimonas sp.]